MSEEGRYGEAEGDDGQTVEVDEQEDGVWVGVVDNGSLTCRYEKYRRDEDAADGHRRRELERPGQPVQVPLHAHQFHRLLKINRTGLRDRSFTVAGTTYLSTNVIAERAVFECRRLLLDAPVSLRTTTPSD